MLTVVGARSSFFSKIICGICCFIHKQRSSASFGKFNFSILIFIFSCLSCFYVSCFVKYHSVIICFILALVYKFYKRISLCTCVPNKLDLLVNIFM